MKGLKAMWLKKLRHNRLQFILVACILFFTAAILSACLCFTVETNNYTQNYYSKGKSPDFFINIQGKAQGKLFTEKAKSNKEFTNVEAVNGISLKEKLEYKGNNITPAYFYLYAPDNYKDLSWKVTPVEYIKSETKPGNGEIWVTKVFADLKSIKLGDTISVKNSQHTKLKVSALIDDAVCQSTLVGVYPFYVNKSTLIKLGNEAVSTFVTISSKKSENSVSVWLHSLPYELTTSITMDYPKSMLLECLDAVSSVVGGIGILAALLIFVVSIIIIRFIIKSNLLKEYRSIGIYKAIGFRDRQIQGFYTKCYLLVGSVSILIGAAAGIPLGYYIGLIITKYIVGFHITSLSVMLAFATFLLLLILLTVNVKFAYNSINAITPVKALQIGVTSTKKKLTRSLVKNAHSPLAMAVNDIFKHKSLSVTYLLILPVSFYLCIFFLSTNYTCSHMQDYPEKWFAIPKSSCMISGPLTSKVVNYVINNSYVANATYGSIIVNGAIKCEKNKYGADLSKCAFSTWSDFSSKKYGLACSIGRNPENAGEIAVGSKTIKGSSLTVGDYIELTVGTTKKSFLVCGIFDTMEHGGSLIEILPSELKKSGITSTLSEIAVNLKSPSDFAAFKNDVQNHFDTLTIEKQMSTVADSVVGVEQIINPVTAILVTVFILFSLLNIINLLLTAQLDSRKKFGVLKSLGFTTGYICRQTFYKTFILSVVSIAVALGLHFAVSAKLFAALIKVDGYINSPELLTIAIVGIFAMIMIISMIFCIPLRKISPVELMEE